MHMQQWLVTLWARETGRELRSTPVTQEVAAAGIEDAESTARERAQRAGWYVDRTTALVMPVRGQADVYVSADPFL